MSLFDFFKKSRPPEDEDEKEKYWSLTTSEGETIDPTWEQIEAGIKNATPEASLFVSLAYFNSGLEIEVIQATAENDIYRFEALPPEDSLEYGDIYVNDSLNYKEVVKLFERFHQNHSVTGYRGWLVEKNN